jgi:hypothetical protein
MALDQLKPRKNLKPWQLEYESRFGRALWTRKNEKAMFGGMTFLRPFEVGANFIWNAAEEQFHQKCAWYLADVYDPEARKFGLLRDRQ